MIKSILLHLANDPGHAARVGVALDLARRHGATLRSVFVEPTGDIPIRGRGASYAFVSESRAAARETAARLSSEIRSGCERAGIGCEWIDEPGDPVEIIARGALLADLVIIGRHRAGTGIEAEMCEELPAMLPCPLLTVPQGWHGRTPGGRVLVAWRRDVCAARALKGALPLLQNADSVTVLTVGDEENPADVVRYLSTHDVTAEPRRDYGNDGDAGEVIAGVADEIGADLVVMGSYSRSRMREMMLGGATRHIVNNMRWPILFAH